ncbi:hypothetical protein B0H11DRAFT_1912700 [Mycena galericulata]|nr:hypothetical protein B0H11DRAFT_1912700 [Mycena galericulata]
MREREKQLPSGNSLELQLNLRVWQASKNTWVFVSKIAQPFDQSTNVNRKKLTDPSDQPAQMPGLGVIFCTAPGPELEIPTSERLRRFNRYITSLWVPPKPLVKLPSFLSTTCVGSVRSSTTKFHITNA